MRMKYRLKICSLSRTNFRTCRGGG